MAKVSSLAHDIAPKAVFQIIFFCVFNATIEIFFALNGSFPGGSDGKESACNVGDPGSIAGSGRHP